MQKLLYKLQLNKSGKVFEVSATFELKFAKQAVSLNRHCSFFDLVSSILTRIIIIDYHQLPMF